MLVVVNRYLLENRRPEAGERFAALAALFDPWTFRHLDALGLGEGWRCWEVGAGGVSVPRGLAERVGTSGRVLATDIDVAWMEPAAGEALEVRRHDVIRVPPPSDKFDLIHARLVLVHLEDRAATRELKEKISTRQDQGRAPDEGRSAAVAGGTLQGSRGLRGGGNGRRCQRGREGLPAAGRRHRTHYAGPGERRTQPVEVPSGTRADTSPHAFFISRFPGPATRRARPRRGSPQPTFSLRPA